jgi:AcrR family transcriptional regulator
MELDSVKIAGRFVHVTSATDRYHHGDLPNALRKAAAEVIDERGLPGFSLREVARRAGVSHTAPAHHFGDVRGLLTSLAEEGLDALYDVSAAAAASHDDPVERLVAIGVAYVELARTHPAHCQVMFRTDLVDPDDDGLQTCGLRAYAVLEDAVSALKTAEQLDVGVDDAAWLCWSAMQGLVVLEPKISMINTIRNGSPIATNQLVQRYVHLIVDGMRGSRPTPAG